MLKGNHRYLYEIELKTRLYNIIESRNAIIISI